MAWRISGFPANFNLGQTIEDPFPDIVVSFLIEVCFDKFMATDNADRRNHVELPLSAGLDFRSYADQTLPHPRSSFFWRQAPPNIGGCSPVKDRAFRRFSLVQNIGTGSQAEASSIQFVSRLAKRAKIHVEGT